MTTSGVFASTVDLFIECECGWAGTVGAVEDSEDLTLTWSCPGCGHHEEGELA